MMSGHLKTLCLFMCHLSFLAMAYGQKANGTRIAGTQKETGTNSDLQGQIGFDSLLLHSFLEDHPKLRRYETALWDFYRKRNFTYVWFDRAGLLEQAGHLTLRVLNLEEEGVFKKLFYAEELDSLVYAQGTLAAPAKPKTELELLLTGEYFVFTGMAWQGMDPLVSTSNDWMLPRKKMAYGLYLDSVLRSGKELMDLADPVYRQYGLLKNYLRKYRFLADNSDWPVIYANPAAIEHRDSAMVRQVKKRLFLLEDYDGSLTDSLWDDRFRLALLRFQDRHGLATVGIINSETIAALNVPLKTRIKQVLVNLERSRWLPVTASGDYLAINIPEFKMHVYRNDQLLWSCAAVVGSSANPTTLFYGEIDRVVFSPYWYVPESIVIEDILPGMRLSSDFLERHQMEITGRRNGIPTVRQKPGPSNSLGRVKFLFPNSYSIYLHDTPSRHLFRETDRAFSHGCIRIAEPAKLAAFLLKDDRRWNVQTIRLAMRLGKEKQVALVQKFPVFIAYFTAFIDRDGKLNFRKDIYGLDDRLASTIIAGNGDY